MDNINSKVTITKNMLIKRVKGFSLVEVLLSVTLFTLFVLGISGGLAYSMQSSKVTAYKSKAVFLSDEGLEAARSIRNSSYDALIAGTHGLDSTGNTWALSGTSETIGEYTRTIEISDIDSTTKQITSKVSWPVSVGGGNSVSTSVFLTNWLREISQIWTNPTLGNTLDLGGNQDGISLVYLNNYVYAVRSSGTPNFITIDVSGDSPSIGSSNNVNSSATNISISPSGGVVAITSGTNNSELVLYNTSNPNSPTQYATYNAPGNANALSSFITQGNLVYLTRARSNDKELIVLNISDPSNPTVLGSADFNSDLNDIFVSGNYAYISTSDTAQELAVFDISNPNSPTLVGSFNSDGNSQGTSISVLDTTLLLGTSSGNVHILDISTPSSPVLSGTYSTGTNSRINDISIKADKSLMFIALGNNGEGFQVVNITNTTAPILLGFLDVGSSLSGLSYDNVRDRVYGIGSGNNSEFVIINSN